MSDGPVKLVPPDGHTKGGTGDGPPALDDIILGDDDQTVPTPAVRTAPLGVSATVAAAAAPGDAPHATHAASGDVKDAKDTRKRAKLTLRIPDDEISRPQLPATTPMGGVPAVGTARSPSDPGLRPPSDPAVRPGSTLSAGMVGKRPGSSPDLGSGSRPPPPPPPPAVMTRGSRPPSSPDLGSGSRPPPPLPVMNRGSRPPSNPDLDRKGSRPPSKPDPEMTAVMPIRPNRIVAVGPPDDTLELPAVDLEKRGRAVGIDGSNEPGWTPYQPTVADQADVGGARINSRGNDAAAAAAQAAMREPARTMIDDPNIRRGDGRDSRPSMSDEIPIDEAEPVNRDSYDELATSPRLPVALDSEDIKLDDGERHTDPGDVPEVDADDLVSVESIPQQPHSSPHSPHSPPPLKPGGKISNTPPPPIVTVTATALMSGFGPPAAGSGPLLAPLAAGAPRTGADGAGLTPSAPAVATNRAPSGPPPTGAVPHAPPPAPHAAPHPHPPRPPQTPQEFQPQPVPGGPSKPHLELSAETPAAGTPMARRQQPAGGPFGFMPQVGALAPPPMNEAAANRKKTRPWWEDLFNDDFIRTMAKITDGDIAREVNFIEESLGCEAGATILDLACGTGRHAVELATRGYQVVGFDLSLAMLARASDEAQDRKQKINFVQGDMREMTFEETFDGIFSWNTSFGFFDEEKNAAVIAKVHRALKKGGQFLLDVVNRDNLVRQAPSLAWFEGDGCICMDEMQIDFITSRMRVKRTLMMDDGRTKEIEYSIRVYSLHELGKMLHDNGFRVAEVSGRTGTPGVFFGCESPRTLILAEKR